MNWRVVHLIFVYTLWYSAPGTIRTYDQRIRSPLLYPAELQEHPVYYTRFGRISEGRFFNFRQRFTVYQAVTDMVSCLIDDGNKGVNELCELLSVSEEVRGIAI